MALNKLGPQHEIDITLDNSLLIQAAAVSSGTTCLLLCPVCFLRMLYINSPYLTIWTRIQLHYSAQWPSVVSHQRFIFDEYYVIHLWTSVLLVHLFLACSEFR